MNTDHHVKKVSIDEILADSGELLGKRLEVEGTLRNVGTNYFTDLKPQLQDAGGHAIAVTAWLPVEVMQPPPGAPVTNRPKVLSDYLDKRVALTGEWVEVDGQTFLHTEKGELLRLPSKRLSDEELSVAAGIGGVGIYGYGRLEGELHVAGRGVLLITAAKGTRSQVSFTLDLPVPKARQLEGHRVWISGLIHKLSPWTGTITRATVIRRPLKHWMPGDHLPLSGKIDNRRPVGVGGEAPPSGSYLVLAGLVQVGIQTVGDLFIEGRTFASGQEVNLYGRLEARSYGGVEIPPHAYVALSGVSDLGAGEPYYDGVQFHSARSDALLRALVVKRGEIFDAPNDIVVLDSTAARAFLGSIGGFLRPGTNPFHGFRESAEIKPPTDADRGAVLFTPEGQAESAATGVPLLLVGEQAPPPGSADMFAFAWYFDEATETVYQFATGGIAGFVNRMQSVIHFSGWVGPRSE